MGVTLLFGLGVALVGWLLRWYWVSVLRGVNRVVFDAVAWRLSPPARDLARAEILADLEQGLWDDLTRHESKASVAVSSLRRAANVAIHSLELRRQYRRYSLRYRLEAEANAIVAERCMWAWATLSATASLLAYVVDWRICLAGVAVACFLSLESMRLTAQAPKTLDRDLRRLQEWLTWTELSELQYLEPALKRESEPARDHSWSRKKNAVACTIILAAQVLSATYVHPSPLTRTVALSFSLVWLAIISTAIVPERWMLPAVQQVGGRGRSVRLAVASRASRLRARGQ